jgi:hypothetical protein
MSEEELLGGRDERIEQAVQKDLLGEPIKEKKVRKRRATPRFWTLRVGDVTDKETFIKVDEGKSHQDCEKKANKLPDGKYKVFCLHSELDIVSEMVKTVHKVKR